jgi:ubiquinone/menaquinone biosynthesis C-methylase UbiE
MCGRSTSDGADGAYFAAIASRYRETSTLQRSAAGRLFELLELRPGEAVLDLGCGTGHITAEIHALTGGDTVGADPSPEMVAEARRGSADTPGLEFVVAGAESLHLPARFDAVFCNSVLQWFSDPGRALANGRAALRPGGRMAVQAPATAAYCPAFIRAVSRLAHDARTRDTWAAFRSPWLVRETAEDYAALSTGAGFTVLGASIDEQVLDRPPGTVMEMFESGAARAYLNPACYGRELPAGYLEAARELVARDFAAQAGADGKVRLTLARLYLLARRD